MDEETNTCLLNFALPISVSPVANSFKIEGPATEFVLLPPVNTLSDFEDESVGSTMSEGFDNAINDPTIMLDTFILPEDMCNNLVEGIKNGTTSIVLDGYFDVSSPIGPTMTSAVILAPSTECHQRYRTKGYNWVINPEASQSVYRSKLTDIIASLTILNVLVRHHNITNGAVTIMFDGKTVMDESRGD